MSLCHNSDQEILKYLKKALVKREVKFSEASPGCGVQVLNTGMFDNRMASLFILIKDGLLKYYSVMEISAPRRKLHKIADLICLINPNVVDGSFYFDFESGEIKYQYFVDCSNVKLDENVIFYPIAFSVSIIDKYKNAFLASMLTNKRNDDILAVLDDINEQEKSDVLPSPSDDETDEEDYGDVDDDEDDDDDDDDDDEDEDEDEEDGDVEDGKKAEGGKR